MVNVTTLFINDGRRAKGGPMVDVRLLEKRTLAYRRHLQGVNWKNGRKAWLDFKNIRALRANIVDRLRAYGCLHASPLSSPSHRSKSERKFRRIRRRVTLQFFGQYNEYYTICRKEIRVRIIRNTARIIFYEGQEGEERFYLALGA